MSIGNPAPRWQGVVESIALGVLIHILPRPLSRWLIISIVLTFACVYPIQHKPDPTGWHYYIPPYGQALIGITLCWYVFGFIHAMQMVSRNNREYQAALIAYHNAQTPVETRYGGRTVIDADEAPPAPQRPTGPSPTPPAPAPSAPMGSNLPTLWVPTYHGPQRELQRRETSLEGLWMNDHRRVDPDDL